MYSLITTVKLNSVDQQAWLTYVLGRIGLASTSEQMRQYFDGT